MTYRKRLVKFLYKIKLYKLAYHLSPSLYYQIIGERISDNITRVMTAWDSFAKGLEGSSK